jgi:hypothetical protein
MFQSVCTLYILVPIDRRFIDKSYILDILDIYHVHPWSPYECGYHNLSFCHYRWWILWRIPYWIGSKESSLVAVIVGLFLAGLAYLQYQQLASFNWDKIEGTISTMANTTTGTFNNYNNKLRYSPYWWYVSRFCDRFYERLMINKCSSIEAN